MLPTLIPALHGLAISISAGHVLKITNTHGTQVIDTWAFTTSRLTSPPISPEPAILTQMSMQHTRASIQRTIPKVGDALYSNERKKMLTITEDTTSGVHDTLIAACDRYRYAELGVKGALEGSHRSCADNLTEALAALGSEKRQETRPRTRDEERADSRLGLKPPQFTPQPLNLFMDIPIHEDRTSLSFEPPTGKPGEYICLKAEVDLLVVVSACPQDILKINGGEPKDASYEII